MFVLLSRPRSYHYTIGLLITVIVGLLVAPQPTLATTIPTDLEVQIHNAVNNERVGADLPKLVLHSRLIEVARLHSQDMLDNNYFAHVNLDDKGPGERLTDAGVVWSVYAENLATFRGYSEGVIPERAVEAWMDSSGHRENILRPTVAYTGVGIALEEDTYLITQVFVMAELSHLESIGVFFEGQLPTTLTTPAETTTNITNTTQNKQDGILDDFSIGEIVIPPELIAWGGIFLILGIGVIIIRRKDK